MSKAPAFQFYPAEFLSDEKVVLMTNQEIGCYIKLLCYCWREGSIPNDTDKIARLCGEKSDVMAQLWLAISCCFAEPLDSHDRLIHPRLEKEHNKQEDYRKERSESGRRGAETRWGANREKNGLAIAKPLAKPIAKHSSSSSSSSSSSINQNLNTYAGNDSEKPNRSAGTRSTKIEYDFENRRFVHLPDEQRAFWQKTYPAIDVAAEIDKAAAWLDSHPENRKKDYKRFINSWLGRAQDRAPVRGGTSPTTRREDASLRELD